MPQYQYRQNHDVVYNEEFINFIKKEKLIFYILDDTVPLNDANENGQIGTAKVDLRPLIQNEVVDLAVEIKGNEGNDKAG